MGTSSRLTISCAWAISWATSRFFAPTILIWGGLSGLYPCMAFGPGGPLIRGSRSESRGDRRTEGFFASYHIKRRGENPNFKEDRRTRGDLMAGPHRGKFQASH